jgi:hypothetical protein
VLAAEHLLDLAGLHFLIERVERLRELGVDRLAGFGPFDEHREIVAALLERHHEIAIQLQAPSALQGLLRFGGVFPEIGRGGFVFEAGQLFVGAGRFKDSSADRPHVCSDPRSGASSRRQSAWIYCTRRLETTTSAAVTTTDVHGSTSPCRA